MSDNSSKRNSTSDNFPQQGQKRQRVMNDEVENYDQVARAHGLSMIGVETSFYRRQYKCYHCTGTKAIKAHDMISHIRGRKHSLGHGNDDRIKCITLPTCEEFGTFLEDIVRYNPVESGQYTLSPKIGRPRANASESQSPNSSQHSEDFLFSMTPPSDLMNKYRNELVDVTTKYRELQEECKKLAIEKADLQHHLAVSSQKASAESKLLDQIYELQKDLDESNKRFLHETSTKEEVEKMLNKSTEQSRILTENLEDLKEQLKSATQNLNEMSGLNNNITCNYNKTKQELEELSSTKTTLQKDLDDMKSRNESLEKTLKECQEQLKNASASAESKFEGQIKELQRDLDESTNRLLHVTSTKEEVEKKLKKSTEHSGTLTKNLKALEGKLKSTTQNLNEMSDSKNNITCKYNEKIQELKELTLSKTTLQKDLDDKKNCLQDMTSRNELLEKRLNELQELHHQLTMANQELERAKKAQCELGNIQSENKVHGKKAVSTVFIHIQSPSDPIQEHDPKKIMPLVMCTLSQYGKIQNDNWDWGQCDRRSLNIFIHFQDSESVNRTVQELNGKVLWEDINSKTVTVQRANAETKKKSKL